MRINYLFSILALLLLGLGVLLYYFLHEVSGYHVLLAESGIFILLLYLIAFYKKIVKLMNSIGNGMELLREQDFSSRLKPVGQYEADRIVYIFNRIMDQLKNERLHVREQNHFLDLLIQSSPLGIIIMTLNEEISQMNPVATKMIGANTPEEVYGKRMSQLDTTLANELAAIPMDKTTIVRLNDASVYKCSHSYFIDRGFKHGFYLVENMTEDVIKVERKAYERVIRLMAHEVNNSTAGIISTIDTTCKVLSEKNGTEDLCEIMNTCMERCLSMSHFITRFADVVKIPEPVLQPIRLNDLAASCKRFMEGMCNEHNITLNLECDERINTVRLDISLFEQVLVNIIKNAAESIDKIVGEDKPGQITIRTIYPASIEIVDNGAGINKENESKLFTPFFSTKINGQGIGLMFIREVLTKHGCTFSLRTYPDGLTHFQIVFQ